MIRRGGRSAARVACFRPVCPPFSCLLEHPQHALCAIFSNASLHKLYAVAMSVKKQPAVYCPLALAASRDQLSQVWLPIAHPFRAVSPRASHAAEAPGLLCGRSRGSGITGFPGAASFGNSERCSAHAPAFLLQVGCFATLSPRFRCHEGIAFCIVFCRDMETAAIVILVVLVIILQFTGGG